MTVQMWLRRKPGTTGAEHDPLVSLSEASSDPCASQTLLPKL